MPAYPWKFQITPLAGGPSLAKNKSGIAPLGPPQRLLVVAVPRVEVKVVDNSEGQGHRVDGAGCNHGRIPVLKLRVCFERKVVAEVIVHTDAGGVHHRVSADV